MKYTLLVTDTHLGLKNNIEIAQERINNIEKGDNND